MQSIYQMRKSFRTLLIGKANGHGTVGAQEYSQFFGTGKARINEERC